MQDPSFTQKVLTAIAWPEIERQRHIRELEAATSDYRRKQQRKEMLVEVIGLVGFTIIALILNFGPW